MIERELVTDEVVLIRAALRSRALVVRAPIYDRLASEMKPIGLYQFDAPDAMRICLALNDYAETARSACGNPSHAARVQRLADEFLHDVFGAFPLTEACDMLQAEQRRIGDARPAAG